MIMLWLNHAVQALIEKCWMEDPQQRPSVEDIIAALVHSPAK